ncbi:MULTISPECIES: ribosome-associated translation inhibitor RaiA [unclassified Motilimonas]|uniref:ribosome hibernation-promoting factor, HPF/YfiA family n=1 Tax=Motilimonas TaxID=1914248 RepID=UPI001E62F244|nr:MULTISPECIES: ribosome-associated translation inhibitor RaiA [unclassified Motilimonas]MCE0555985.1 ribosome-associated translation inhibitor RaiA [Motilimonas sp. E26]MDO6526438.1 ribosome-associated translation inhibitor RaiA [Motilimonas sp. 1_MG-2023]
MTIEITSKHMAITTPMREKISARYDRLEKMQLPLIKPHFIITQEPKGFKIEASIGIPNGDLFATATHDDLYCAINKLGQKLEKQLHKHVDKPNAQRTAIHKRVVEEETEAAA